MQAIGVVARFWSTPKESHVVVVKKRFRYIKGTFDFGLWYPKMKNFDIISYSDANWAGSLDDRKSTSGNAFFLGELFVT